MLWKQRDKLIKESKFLVVELIDEVIEFQNFLEWKLIFMCRY